MVLLAVLCLLLALGIIASARVEMTGIPWGRTALWTGGVLAFVRIVVYGMSLALYNGNADWRQSVGYALLIINAGGELAVAPAWSNAKRGPSLAVAGLIVLTSVVLGFLWSWIRERPLPK